MSHKNNFDLVRILLALVVFLVHASALSAEPALAVFQRVLDSGLAIKGFFVISGYLVMKSLQNSDSLAAYAEKRVRRIYPAYLFAILLCFLIGLAVTEQERLGFLLNGQTWLYLAANSVFLNFLEHGLPGVFPDNPYTDLNGALWTLKVEVMLYAGLPLIALCFRGFGVVWTGVLAAAGSLVWVYACLYWMGGELGATLARQAPGQAVLFVTGACLQRLPGWKRPLPWIAGLSLVPYLLLRGSVWEPLIEPVFVVSAVMVLAERFIPPLGVARFGDVSYGLYLYHYPIIQLFVWLGVFAAAPWFGLLASLVLSLGLARLSWSLIEAPLLSRSPVQSAGAPGLGTSH